MGQQVKSFQDVKVFIGVAKCPDMQNLEVNKVTGTKQVSEAGNYHMPRRALNEKKIMHAHAASFKSITLQGLVRRLKSTDLVAMRCT